MYPVLKNTATLASEFSRHLQTDGKQSGLVRFLQKRGRGIRPPGVRIPLVINFIGRELPQVSRLTSSLRLPLIRQSVEDVRVPRSLHTVSYTCRRGYAGSFSGHVVGSRQIRF